MSRRRLLETRLRLAHRPRPDRERTRTVLLLVPRLRRGTSLPRGADLPGRPRSAAGPAWLLFVAVAVAAVAIGWALTR